MATAALTTTRKRRGLLRKLGFPSLRVRFAIAVLLTFFPMAILYGLPYPLPDLIMLVAWIWAFPSVVGCVVLVMLPIAASPTYGYFAFNLLCFCGTLATALAASKSFRFDTNSVSGLYKFTRNCMLLVLGICLLQVLTPPVSWYSIFPGMSLGDTGGRGAGLRSEPSLLAGPLSIYVALAVARINILRANRSSCSDSAMRARRIFRESLFVILALLVLTRSISVLLMAVCFLPALIGGRRKLLVPLFAAGVGLVVGVVAFGNRIREAMASASGSVMDLATVAVGSWRSIPDLIILMNYRQFLLPGNPGEIRSKLNELAVMISPVFAWLQNTYSTFSAGATTLGLVVTGATFLGGLALGLKMTKGRIAMQATWFLVYLANWFLTPKYEAAGWIALGVLACTGSPSESCLTDGAPE